MLEILGQVADLLIETARLERDGRVRKVNAPRINKIVPTSVSDAALRKTTLCRHGRSPDATRESACARRLPWPASQIRRGSSPRCCRELSSSPASNTDTSSLRRHEVPSTHTQLQTDALAVQMNAESGRCDFARWLSTPVYQSAVETAKRGGRSSRAHHRYQCARRLHRQKLTFCKDPLVGLDAACLGDTEWRAVRSEPSWESDFFTLVKANFGWGAVGGRGRQSRAGSGGRQSPGIGVNRLRPASTASQQ
ncbi:hypothetical protein K523DRAFT_360139 [Schizophyllum commune Tattone D]|nr:hypothetical protein K523DRAFT_360139 [Schizophyllum commune Tattone D]